MKVETPTEKAWDSAMYEHHQLENMGLSGHGYRGVISAIVWVGYQIASAVQEMETINQNLEEANRLNGLQVEQLTYLRGAIQKL